MLRAYAGSAPQANSRPRTEARALAAVAEHGTATRAAEALFLSPHTLRHQLKLAYRRLGVHNRADAIRLAREAGILDPGD